MLESHFLIFSLSDVDEQVKNTRHKYQYYNIVKLVEKNNIELMLRVIFVYEYYLDI